MMATKCPAALRAASAALRWSSRRSPHPPPPTVAPRRDFATSSRGDVDAAPRFDGGRPSSTRPAPRAGAAGRARTVVTVTRTTPSSSSSPDDGDVDDGKNGDASSAAAAAPSYHHRGDDPAGAGGGIAVTASCASRIRQLASSRPNPDAVYLRLYVDAGGCSGFQYKFLLLSEEEDGGGVSSNGGDGEGGEDGTIDPEEDVVFVRDGMRVVVDQTSLDLLRGSTIDYVSEMIRSSFAVVGNPQSESACGCGSSFAVKNFESNPAMD